MTATPDIDGLRAEETTAGILPLYRETSADDLVAWAIRADDAGRAARDLKFALAEVARLSAALAEADEFLEERKDRALTLERQLSEANAREATARAEERERAANIALAIDSGRGNEKQIAAAIRSQS